MRKVVVDTEELRKVLIKNRDIHVKEYEELMTRFKQTVLELIKEVELKYSLNNFIQFVEPDRPQNHKDDYDRVIKMLEMSVEKEVELSDQEFHQFVMDNWSWSLHFRNTKLNYGL